MTSFLPFAPQTQSHQHGGGATPGSGLAGEHDAVEHQRLVAPAEGAGVEGCDRLVEALRHPAHRGRADRPAEQAQQDLAELAGRQPEDETRGSSGRSRASGAS